MLDDAGKVAWKPSLPKSVRCQETLWRTPQESKLNPKSLELMDPRSLDQRSPVVLEESLSTALRRACLAEVWCPEPPAA